MTSHESICLVVQNVYDDDPRVRRKAEALVAAGYSVDVLSLRAPSGRRNYSVDGVNVHTLSLRKRRRSPARYAFEYAVFFFWAFGRLPWQMLRRRYAVIDVNSLPDFLIFAPALARSMGAKLILDLHEIAPEFYMSKYRLGANAWMVRLLKYMEKVSIDFADRVITIHEPIEDLLATRGLPRAKSTVIMNAADETRFAAPGQPPATHRRDPEKFVMLYHGTLTRLYGLDIALEAFALTHKEMPGAELWILGSGSEKDALGELARARGVASRVRLVGPVASTDIPSWLRRSDVGLLPIRRDAFLDFAFPNKLPEFIVAGVPVIVSRLKAIRHYFSEDALAYCDAEDPAALSKQMLRLYRDPPLRDRLTRQARKEYAPIRWDLMKQRYVTLVGELIGSGGRRAPEQRDTARPAIVTK